MDYQIGQLVVTKNVGEVAIPEIYEGKIAKIVDIIKGEDYTDVYVDYEYANEDDSDVWFLYPEHLKAIGRILNI